MPATHLALLRGINVGKAKRVPMVDLRAALVELGATDVRTLLNSGNVVFGATGRVPGAEAIEQAVQARTAVSARVTLLTAADWREIVDGNPIAALCSDPSRMVVAVFADAAGAATVAPLMAAYATPAGSGERAALGRRALYLWCPGGLLDSPLAAALLGSSMKAHVTSRNWATALKLRAML